jgi:GT2 family glycosyltransferase
MFWNNGIKAVHEPFKNDNFRSELARHQNIIKDYFLNGNYDYLMMVESDVFTGECVIEKLVSYAEVYSATLCLTATVDSRLVRSEKILDRSLGYEYMGQGVVPMRKFLNDPDAKLTATGIGCTLFRREALEEVEFRVDLELNKNAFSDTFIFTDIATRGYEVLIDSNMICEHRK